MQLTADQRDAWEAIFKTERSNIAKTLMKKGMTQPEAEEWTQFAFFKGMVNSQATGEMPRKPVQWLITVAKHGLWDALRRKRREANLEDLGDLPQHSCSGLEESLHKLFLLQRICDTVDPEEMEFMSQLYIERFTVEELAVQESVARPTIRVRAYRIKERIKARATKLTATR
jgi:RNA polymerase sigma factor (sigma-70 family)